MSAGLDLYRDLIPEHGAGVVSDTMIETYLTLAARRLSASAFGTVFPEAAVYWAADAIEQGRMSGAFSADPSCKPLVVEAATSEPPPTRFRRLFVDLRDTRAAGAPRGVF